MRKSVAGSGGQGRVQACGRWLSLGKFAWQMTQCTCSLIHPLTWRRLCTSTLLTQQCNFTCFHAYPSFACPWAKGPAAFPGRPAPSTSSGPLSLCTAFLVLLSEQEISHSIRLRRSRSADKGPCWRSPFSTRRRMSREIGSSLIDTGHLHLSHYASLSLFSHSPSNSPYLCEFRITDSFPPLLCLCSSFSYLEQMPCQILLLSGNIRSDK